MLSLFRTWRGVRVGLIQFGHRRCPPSGGSLDWQRGLDRLIFGEVLDPPRSGIRSPGRVVGGPRSCPSIKSVPVRMQNHREQLLFICKYSQALFLQPWTLTQTAHATTFTPVDPPCLASSLVSSRLLPTRAHRHLPQMALLRLAVRNMSLSATMAQKRSTKPTSGTGLPLKYSVYPTSMSRDSFLLSPTHQDPSDVLELKMLQRELPRAAQPIDALSSKPFANVFLSHVPIPLLPLNPTTVCASQSTPPNMTSPPLPRTTTPARNRNPPLLRSPASSICSSPPPIEYRRSPPKSLPDQHVIRPHNIPVPPPPVPLRRTYPPAPSMTQTHPKIKSNLPPKRTFSFVPLLDDSSHCRPSLTPTSSTTTTPSGGASPVFGSAPLSGTPESPPLTTLSASASSASLSASSSHSSSCSDPDRSDQGYVSDCSITEVSTPSLTTASLASSSPPDSPGLEHDFFYEHGERGGTRRACELPGLESIPMQC